MDIATVTVNYAVYGNGTLIVVDVAVVQINSATDEDLSRGTAGDFGTFFFDVNGDFRSVINLRDTTCFAGILGVENVVSAQGKQIAVIHFAVATGIKAAQVFFALSPLVGDLMGAEEGVFVFHLQPVQYHPSGTLQRSAGVGQA